MSVLPATMVFTSSKSPKMMSALKSFTLGRMESSQKIFPMLAFALHETSLLPLELMSY